MWRFEENTVRLDLSKVSKDFRISSKNELILVCPKKGKWDWSDDERWLRSVIVNKKGYVISSGWPKFGNFGEFLQDTNILCEALKSDAPVFFTTKYDGSLCIRSVYRGKVILRTRGTIDGGDYDEDGKAPFGVEFRNVAKDKYPLILNPEWMPDRSLLFEYISPHNHIVVRYNEADLIFLGSVFHNHKIECWNNIKKIAEEGSLNLVGLKQLPREPKLLREEINTWNEEGVVARYENDDLILVKIKSDIYCAQHFLKSNLNYKFVASFLLDSSIKGEEHFADELKKLGMDFENLNTARELYKEYHQLETTFDQYLNQAKEAYDNFKGTTRKEYAMLALKQPPMIKTLMFSVYDDKKQRINLFRRKFLKNRGR